EDHFQTLNVFLVADTERHLIVTDAGTIGGTGQQRSAGRGGRAIKARNGQVGLVTPVPGTDGDIQITEGSGLGGCGVTGECVPPGSGGKIDDSSLSRPCSNCQGQSTN